MTELPNFSDILTKNFRWPVVGDRLFEHAADPWDDARLTSDQFSRSVVMADGYKQAADVLVQTALDRQHRRDFFVYPIIFCYRQYIELELKWMLWTYGRAVGVQANWKSHDLMTLWKEFEKVQSLSGADMGGDSTKVVADCIREFADIDEKSFNFRFAAKTDGTPIVLRRDRVDLARLRDVMKGIAGYFDGCDGYLHHLQRS